MEALLYLGGYRWNEVYGFKDNSEHVKILSGIINGFKVYNSELFAFDCKRFKAFVFHTYSYLFIVTSVI